MLFRTIQQAKRFVRMILGFTLLLIGVAMLISPGPAWLVILCALGLLAAEFVWARRLLDRMKHGGERIRDAVLMRSHARETSYR
ncbi:MAG TPA: PGPGW domain-containing protein [Candidatus Acidoferrales bacterium]|nr:PGPGW domain-containing protein [Candidatus Acidoferrales bacterium]